MSKGRVLLTGAGGLIGRHVPGPLAAAGYEVVAVSRRPGAAGGVRTVAGNLLDANDRARILSEVRPDHLLHLAWHDGPVDRWTSPANLDWAVATIALTRAFAAAGGRRAVLVGSCAEYDWSGGRLSEATALRPATPYGAAKAGTGLALMGAGAGLGMSLAWARPFFCYGPGEPQGRLLGDLIKGIAAGQPVDCTDGLQRRDFLHTEDIGRALAMLLDSDVTGAVNIASGHAVQVRDLIETVARQMGRPDLVMLGAKPRPASDPDLIEADVTRLTTEIGFRPAHDIERGIAAVLRAEKVAA